jgi:hypothetical protein
VTEEILRLYHLYHSRLALHPNNLITDLASPAPMARRLRRRWPTDLLRDLMVDKQLYCLPPPWARRRVVIVWLLPSCHFSHHFYLLLQVE